ncbi:hypothetical protein FRC03_011153 [Tulasnella sp. 419]|nr:hypothetical protein FRC02_004450 [Tulasnella sp. 418]KAG8970135.1 hypothetical protein FRC03_011153 [Tulasnella sp. 419]
MKTVVALAFALECYAGVTVYNSLDPSPTATGPGGGVWTGLPSRDPLKLTPPALPPIEEYLATIPVQLFEGGVPDLSHPQKGDFLGFSIELSVFEPLFGFNETHLRPEFLNHLGVLQERGGSIAIRVGGNTQDKAQIVDSLPNGAIIGKTKNPNTGPTDTPIVQFTDHVFRAMAQVSSLLNVNYFFGVPFLNTNADGNASRVVAAARQFLGDRLLGLQMANEINLYAKHQKKPPEYNEASFFADTTSMIQSLPLPDQLMMGPSVCCEWETNHMLDIGYLDQFQQNLKYVTAMHYPTSNCDGSRLPQEYFPTYLTHQSATDFVAPYIIPVARSQALGKPFILLETNTASCGGFPGISDSFGSALWGIDMGLKMASSNFTNAMFHVGGQNVYYNPFTPPPTNETAFRKWSTGAIFYSNVFVAEAFGKSGRSQVIDLNLNNGNNFSPGYAIYEDGKPTRVALINFVDDPTGSRDYTAAIQVGGADGLPGTTPSRVYVKYLSSASVSDKWNITWANQTFGDQFKSDGRLYGTLHAVPIDCADNICNVPMKAPSAAIVFLSEQALSNSTPAEGETITFTTSTQGAKAYIDWASVAASNGRNGQMPLGSTSPGSSGASNGAITRVNKTTAFDVASVIIGLVVGISTWLSWM